MEKEDRNRLLINSTKSRTLWRDFNYGASSAATNSIGDRKISHATAERNRDQSRSIFNDPAGESNAQPTASGRRYRSRLYRAYLHRDAHVIEPDRQSATNKSAKTTLTVLLPLASAVTTRATMQRQAFHLPIERKDEELAELRLYRPRYY